MKQIQSRITQVKNENSKSIDLSGLDLIELPYEIFNLHNLEDITLSNNRLKTIPQEIERLEKLRSINLYGNQLTEIPESIYALKELDTLILTSNPLCKIDNNISVLENLRRLAIAQSDISFIPSALAELPHLNTLNLSSPLGNGKISSLPKEFGNLANLLMLYLSGNKIEHLPDSIAKLKNLFYLDISGNRLNSFPFSIFNLNDLEVLNLGGNIIYGYNSIEEVPREINRLSKLRNLDLSYNKIKTLPDELYELANLEYLILKGNQLPFLSNKITQLESIKQINLDQNKLSSLPKDIGKVKTLRILEARSNFLTTLPLSLKKSGKFLEVALEGNKLDIPPEILSKNYEPDNILQYYFQTHQGDYFLLGEAKIAIIGQGSVGKTSLARMLIWDEFFESETKTEGIVIHKWEIKDRRNKLPAISINLWDFGGQEIMHATHQFFLTKRSLYLLVLDARLTQEENRIEYWLKIIQSFGGDSPVLIIGNKIDQHPLDIDRTGLQKKYPNITGILETSAATGAGIDELKEAITEQVNNLPHVRDLLPETWFTVKTKLEGLGQEENFITEDKYLELCAENEVSDETSQRTLIGFLHDLGVVLHFQDDPRLESLGILNPQWVTNGVYKILNSHELFKNKGVLERTLLNKILDAPEYPSNKRLFIVDMMRKFELCYDLVPDQKFLVPDLLPKDEPQLSFNGIPAFEYAYPVLPSSVITRFIVRMNQKIDDGFVWRTGVVLKIGKNKALVKADIEDKKITIAIDGLEHTRRDALSAIRYQLDEIHASIKGLNPDKLVPVPDAESQKYEFLLQLERSGVKEFPIPGKVGNKPVLVDVSQLLSGVESESQRRKEQATTINNYYAASDGGIIVGRDFSGNLVSGNYNKINAAEIDPELKDTLLQLAEAVNAMLEKLPAEESAEVAEDFSKLADEAIKPKPNKRWYSVSIEGLIAAAENLDKLGEPVINLSKKVLALLTGGLVE